MFKRLFLALLTLLALLTPALAAFPAIVTSSSGTSSAGTSTSHTVTLPASIVPGNLLIVIALNGSTSSASSLTTPPGWNSLVNNNTASRNIAVLWRPADGTEGATLGLTWGAAGRGTWTAYQFSGWDSASTPAVNTPSSFSSTTPVSGALTPSWGSADTAWVSVLGGTAGTSTSVTSYPTNFTLGQLLVQNSGFTGQHSISAVANVTTGTETPGSWTITPSNSGVALTIGIKPAAGGAPINFPFLP